MCAALVSGLTVRWVGLGGIKFVLVGVSVVRVMEMTVMEVIGVPIVLYARVTAILSVGMRVGFVRSVR